MAKDSYPINVAMTLRFKSGAISTHETGWTNMRGAAPWLELQLDDPDLTHATIEINVSD